MNAATSRLVPLLLERYGGRTDMYLRELRPEQRPADRPDMTAITVHKPLTTAVVEAHLFGKERIGIFADTTASYLRFDFDGKNLPGGADEAFEQLQKVDRVLKELGLPGQVVELTRSGKGYGGHLFLDPDDRPVVAELKAFGLAVLRGAALPDDEDEDHGHTGVYPHTPGPKGVGKTAFMPLGGFLNGGISRFLDTTTREPLERQEGPLEDPQFVTREQVLAATAKLPAAKVKTVTSDEAPAVDLEVHDGDHAWPKVRKLTMFLRNHHPKNVATAIVIPYATVHGVIERHGVSEVHRLIDSAYEKPPLFVMTEWGRTELITAGDVWPELIPLNRHVVPPFPTHVLPTTLNAFVGAVATATRTPPDLAGCMVLSAVSTAIGGKYRVVVNPGWQESVCTWNLVALRSGELKSPVFRAASSPIWEYERAEGTRLASDISDSAVDFRLLTAKLAKAEKAAAHATEKDDPLGLARKEALVLATELKENPPLITPRFIADDTTPEKLTSLIQDHGGRMAILAAEGGIFANVFGRYVPDNKPKLEAMCNAFDGDPIVCDRTSREGEHILNPSLTMGVCIQPRLLDNLMADKFADQVGFLPRFSFSLPVSLVGTRPADPDPVPEVLQRKYDSMITRLLDLPANRVDKHLAPVALWLSPGALRRLVKLHDVIEPQLKEGENLWHLSAWAGKFRGRVLRLAAQLHFADGAEPGGEPGKDISEETFARAEELGMYFLEHAKVAYEIMGGNPATADARVILSWIAGKGLRTFSARDLYRARTATFRNAAATEPGLSTLEERGYIRVVSSVIRQDKRSRQYEVNPGMVWSRG